MRNLSRGGGGRAGVGHRVNGAVRNIDAWYGAFGVKPANALCLKQEDRVRIW
jgi:predicted metalloendopeptidase